MKLKVFSIFDSKAAFFGNPFFDGRVESAIRMFTDAVNQNDPQNGFYKHPEDYSLFLLGEFDNETAEFDFPNKPQNLVTASAVHRGVEYTPQKENLVVN